MNIFIIVLVSLVILFIGLSYYLTLTDTNRIKDIASFDSEHVSVNLTEDDTTYQSIYPEYEIAYVYILNVFSKQLDNLDDKDSSDENFYTVANDFEELVSDFFNQAPDSPTEFQESRKFAVSSALKTQIALKEYKKLIKDDKLLQLEDKKDILTDAVSDFKKSQKTYKDAMEKLN